MPATGQRQRQLATVHTERQQGRVRSDHLVSREQQRSERKQCDQKKSDEIAAPVLAPDALDSRSNQQHESRYKKNQHPATKGIFANSGGEESKSYGRDGNEKLFPPIAKHGKAAN